MSEEQNLLASKPISHSYESTGSSFVPTDVDTAEAQDKPGSSSSVSFHNISYEVSNWCGRKRKIILNSARSVILAVHCIYQCRESWPRPQAAYNMQTKALSAMPTESYTRTS